MAVERRAAAAAVLLALTLSSTASWSVRPLNTLKPCTSTSCITAYWCSVQERDKLELQLHEARRSHILDIAA
eukprot:12065-Heterococcus_DN1.PRE.1